MKRTNVLTGIFLMVFVAAAAGCTQSSSDPSADGDASAADGDAEEGDADADREPLEEFVPHVPIVCPVNHCQARRLKTGQFCLGETSEGGEPAYNKLISCSRDEDNCIIETATETCDYGCDPAANACKPVPIVYRLTGALSRVENPLPVAEEGAPATDFAGTVVVSLHRERRVDGQEPGSPPVGQAVIENIDLTNFAASVEYTQNIVLAPNQELAAGTYYVDASLRVDDGFVAGQGLVGGDLVHYAPVEVTVPADGDIEADFVFTHVFDK
ncbi:MAG: hypothetical protein C4523_20935 [Myxococcales bacterium]|nr:MAG: hypothetical protein C4523_20935 [Myxococcales bacterium]